MFSCTPSPTPSTTTTDTILPLFRQRRENVIKAMHAAGIDAAIVRAAPRQTRSRDTDYPYRQNSYFYYLTGLTEPDAALLLTTHSSPASTLFCQEKNPAREMWEGACFGPQAAQTLLGFDAAFPIHSLDATLTRRNLVPGDITAILDDMRSLKAAQECEHLRCAARISAAAHRRAMQMCRPGMHEYELEAELLYIFRRSGAQAPAYTSIVAAGKNACVLHYPAGSAVLREGDLVLIDAACESDHYAADITRTFPVSGRFSGPQRELYEIVLAAQQSAIHAARPGASFDTLHLAATRLLSQGLLDTGLLDARQHGNVDDVIENQAYTRFYMHKTGHWLGMDVHDCGAYTVCANGQHTPRLFEPGMALTVEPGLYIRPAADIPERYWHTGIRIEDDVIITPSGCEILSRDVPVSVSDIEQLMANR